MPHASPITCVDHHGPGDLLVTGGYDGRVIAWCDGEELWVTEFDDLVNEVRIDPTGTAIAVATADAYAFVLDAETGAHTAALGPHGDDVNVVRWLPDGSGLVCTMDHVDPTVRVWTRGDGAWNGRILARHDSGVFGAAVSPDGRRVATAAEDRTARIWDLRTGEQLHVLPHPGDPETIDWSPDGTVIATGCDDDVCRLWNPDTGVVELELKDASAAVRFVRFSTDGSRLLVGAYDATMRVYCTRTWTVVEEYRLPIQWERAAVVAGDRVVVGSFGAIPVFHPPIDSRPVEPTFGINALAVIDGRVLVGRDDGAVVDVTTAEVLARHESIVNGVAVSPDRRTVASGDYRGVLLLTDLGSGVSTRIEVGHGGPINTTAWNTDGSVVFTAGYDGHVRMWTATGDLLDDWVAHHSPVKSIAWSNADGGILVAGSSDGSLSAWQGRDERWRTDVDDLVLVNAVAVADSGGVAVSASRDLHVRRWNVLDGALLERLPRVHHKSVKGIAVDPLGDRIVTGSYDGTAIVWSRAAADARSVGGWSWQRLRFHGKPGVPGVAFHGRNVFTAGWDGAVARWSADGSRLVSTYHPPR